MSKILITGASGFVGTKFYDLLKKEGHDVYGTYFQHQKDNLIKIDAEKSHQFWNVIREIRPNIVIHTAGIARTDVCEKDPESAFRINVLGTRDVARACRVFNSKMVFLSTSHVFSGSNKMYKETDETKHSFDYYGETKRIAEHLVKEELPDKSIIIRSELLLGYNPEGSSHLVEQAINGDLKLKYNKLRQPLILEDLLSGVQNLVENNRYGIFHIAGRETISYKDLLERMGEMAGTKLKLASEYDQTLHESVLLDTSKATALGIRSRNLDEIFSTLEGQLKSIHPEGQRRSTEY